MGDSLVLPDRIGPVHIVLDWVGGPVAVQVMQQAQIEPGENLQYIQTDGLAGQENIIVPARLINIKPIRIMASGVGSFSKDDMKREMPDLVRALTEMKNPLEVLTAPMKDVTEAWNSEEAQKKRLVLVP
jgi:hypothetical protein